MTTPKLKIAAQSDAVADCEASILGGILLRPDVLVDLAELEPDDFFDLRHKAVFVAIRALQAAGAPVDVLTLETQLDRDGRLAAIGGVAFVGELAMRPATPANVRAYAEVVTRAHLVRRIAIAASDLAQKASAAEYHDAEELLNEGLATLAKLDRKKPDAAKPIRDVAVARVRQLEAITHARERGEIAITGCPTGIAALDEVLGGWQYGVANLLAARPAMGKSATAIASADAATAQGIGAHVFSLEDSEHAYADRGLARRSGIPAERLRQADLREGDAVRLAQAAAALASRTNWLLDARGGLSASEIVRSVRRHARANKTRLVVVDYVQLVRRTNPKLSENDALAEILTEFSDAAKADGMAYLVLSQLNRDLEKRIDKRPQMSDLRGSGALEERAKVIVGQYRGAYYHAKPKRGIDYDCDCPDAVRLCAHAPEHFERQVQLLLLKNNNGRTGSVTATWNGPTTEIW
jgi:replicative DNA helicase